MLLHGIENRDSLSEEHGGGETEYSFTLANPPFTGSLDNA